ncbi:STY0301 family protein [Andreprevotia lacus]|jgi:hypothetical protein|nr:STY0301 family protein [Andreprevotia lacus]
MWLSSGLAGMLLCLLCNSAQAAPVPSCPARAGHALHNVTVFDGDPAELASLVPEQTSRRKGYWPLAYVYAQGRHVTLRCTYADQQTVDVPLSARVERCDYTQNGNTLKLSCR